MFAFVNQGNVFNLQSFKGEPSGDDDQHSYSDLNVDEDMNEPVSLNTLFCIDILLINTIFLDGKNDATWIDPPYIFWRFERY